MSFLIDPPLLFLSGFLLCFGGKRLEWDCRSKIAVGIAITLTFIIFSTLLYADVIRCVFPFFSGMKSSEFMLHTNITGIAKSDVPVEVMIILFLLYPFWLYAGYASAWKVDRRNLRPSKVIYSYHDVKSRRTEPSSSKYAVERDPSASKCVMNAIKKLGGIESFVKKGDKVLIKVNICGGVPDRKGTFTSTNVVGVLVDLVRDAGGVPTIADSDMIWTRFWPAATDSGWKEWAECKDVRLVNLADTEIARFDFGKDSVVGLDYVSKEAVDADVIISVPVMKTHLLTGVTLGMKNMYGTFPKIDKAKYHLEDIEEVIYWINKAFTPNLTVIDGSIGGEGIGPLSCQDVGFDTVVASNDVVTADAIACQLMGYKPLEEVTHLKIAHDRHLGDGSQKYNFEEHPYERAAGKDGNWLRPYPGVKNFYEWATKQVLKFPGWETFFNISANFFLYDLARLPVLGYLTPAFLRFMNDVVYDSLGGQGDTKYEKKRRKINMSAVLIVALISLAGFYYAGYLWSSPLFEFSYLIAIAVSLLAALRMKTRPLLTMIFVTAVVAFLVEKSLISADVLTYTGAHPFPFIVTGWTLMMITILGLSDLFRKWLVDLKMFEKLHKWQVVPTILASLVFAAFYIWEGYFGIAGIEVPLMYLGMMVLGLLYSSRCSIEWNTSLVILSVVLGGYMELAGSLAGFWHYHYDEKLAIFITIAWILNSWAVHGIAFLMGVNLSDSMISGLASPTIKR
jgi:uncharacterized protein (DUF362 family)